VNLAGSKSVAECENNPDAAYQINVAGVRNVSRLAKRYNIRFIHLSTDMIFDGKKGNYSENDAPCPMTVYAKTKYQGEEAALSLGTNTLILRSALCFGMPLGKNHSFSDWLESGFTKSKKMNLFKDQYRTPVYVRDLCRLVAKCIPSKLTGILHAAGDDKVDRVEFARIYAKARGIQRKVHKCCRIEQSKI
ncbi:MAG: sugar nucleotide-binding protein, partial [bacterium]